MSASAYFHRATEDRSKRVTGDERLADQIRELHAELLRLRTLWGHSASSDTIGRGQ